MGLCSLVTRRNGTYVFRKRVPEDLQGIIGTKIIKRSLRTTKPEEAKLKKTQVEAEVMELFAAKRAELQGIPYTPKLTPQTSATLTSTESNALPKGRGMTIQAIFNRWAENKRRTSKNTNAAEVGIKRYQQKLDAFKESQSDMLIGDVTLDILIAFRDNLSSTTKHKSKTINGYLAAIHAMVSFAMNERYINVHPLKGAKYHLKEDNSEIRIPFEKEDLEALFITAEFKAFRDTAPPQFWIPIIGLYTGARIEEIAQLRREDIKETQGIYYFDINERGKDKRVKTKSSVRKVPIHPELLRMGLIEFADSCSTSQSFLFPHLIPCENRRAHSISKWFGDYKRKIGISDSLKVFHSFRHSLIDACRKARIPIDMHMQLAGHKDGSVHGKYGYDHHVTALYPELCKIDYGIDLSSLYVRDVANPSKVDAPIAGGNRPICILSFLRYSITSYAMVV